MDAAAARLGTDPRAATGRWLERAAFVLGAVVASAGSVVLVLWSLHSPVLASSAIGWPRANAALAFLVGGVSLMLVAPEDSGPLARRLGRLGGLFVALVGGLTLIEHTAGVDFGIDEILVKAIPETRSFWPPGRMAPNSSLSFVLTGAALALVDVDGRGLRPTPILGALAFLLAFVAGLVYLFRAGPLLVGLARHAAMMPLTAGLLAALSAGILFLRPKQGLLAVLLSDSAGSAMARRLLPAAVIVPAVLGLLTTRTRVLGLYDAAFETVLQAAGSVAILTVVVARNAFALHRSDLERRRVTAELEQHAAALAALKDELEERVRRRTRELEAANAELESFSYSVSHDLRAPLRWVDGFSQALLEDYGDRIDDTGREYLRHVREASQRMGELIDALLTLSRATRRELVPTRVDLSAEARDIVDELRREAPERRASVSIRPGIVAEGDPVLLHQALDNLLRNAWKFTRTRPEARITLDVTEDGHAVYLRDNGVGFDPGYAHKLFRPFERLHSDEEFEGTGIGLAIVRRIIRRHGGEVWATGAPGAGATFYFTLWDDRPPRDEEV